MPHRELLDLMRATPARIRRALNREAARLNATLPYTVPHDELVDALTADRAHFIIRCRQLAPRVRALSSIRKGS